MVNWMTDSNVERSEEFRTVLFADVEHDPCTDSIGLEAAGVQKDNSGYIPVTSEQTNVPHIYAVGAIVAGMPQLTQVAIEAGILLARRLYAGSMVKCDYGAVTTTVFPSLEYGCWGMFR